MRKIAIVPETVPWEKANPSSLHFFMSKKPIFFLISPNILAF
jgi:hypothetical protein